MASNETTAAALRICNDRGGQLAPASWNLDGQHSSRHRRRNEGAWDLSSASRECGLRYGVIVEVVLTLELESDIPAQ